MILTITNWQKRQTFRSKNPSWIKTYTSLLDDYDFNTMSVDAKYLLMMLWLFAAESGDPKTGVVKITIEEICWRLHRNDPGTVGVAINECVRSNFVTIDQPVKEDGNGLVTRGNRLVTDLLQTCDTVTQNCSIEEQTETDTQSKLEPAKKETPEQTKNGREFPRVEQQVTETCYRPVTDLLQTCSLEGEREGEGEGEKEKKKEKNTKKKKSDFVSEEMLRELWEKFPKVRPKGSMKEFNQSVLKQIDKGESYDTIRNGIERYAKHCNETGSYNKHAHRWIDKSAWDADYSTVAPPPQNSIAAEIADYEAEKALEARNDAARENNPDTDGS